MTNGPCIDDETLARMVAQSLDARERARMVAHLETCDACSRLATEALQLADETRVIGGRYRLEGEIGRGAMGVVFRAHDDVLDRVVAIKLLPGAADPDDRGRARLVRESKAMAKVRHPNVVAVYDAGFCGDEFHVAMEYIPGPTLRRHLAENPVGVPATVALFVKAARGLAAAHEVGVIHRDFKPDNVLVDRDGEPKVADFGLARAVGEWRDDDDDDGDPSPPGDGLTRAGAIVGTVAYMPPEQLAGGAVDPRADVFAVCASLWEAVYGTRPFVESTIEARLLAIERGDVLLPRGQAVDPRLRRVLEQGLAFERGDRFSSMAALADALAATLHGPARRRRALGLVTVVTAALAIGAGVAVALQRDPCMPAIDRLAASWTAASAAAIERAVFDAHGAMAGQLEWTRARASIDGAVAALDQESVAVCEARAATSDVLTERWAQCLRLERGALAHRLELAARGDGDAARGVGQGNALTWCRELATTWAPPSDHGDTTAAEDALAASLALAQLGRTDAALAGAELAVAAAEDTGDASLVARARLQLGMVEGSPERAHAVLQRAATEAAAVGEHSTAALAWIFAGYYARGDTAAACLAAARIERAHVDNAAVREHLGVREALLEGELLVDAGDTTSARVQFERALAAAREHAPAVVPDLLFGATYSAWLGGAFDEALARQQELVRWHESERGPNRQRHAHALWNLADLHLERGEFDDGLAAIRRAQEIGARGGDADDAARQQLSEIELLLRRGELDVAATALADATTRYATLPALPDDLAKLGALRGLHLLLRGRNAEAATALREQIDRLSPRVDFGIDAAEAQALLGEALRRDGRANAAMPAIEAELAALTVGHANQPETGRVALVHAWLLHDLGRHAEAVAGFARARALLLDPAERAWADVGREAVAHALGAAADRTALATARATLGRHAGARRVELATIDALSTP